jgi:tRNA (guanine37-N1)-methyltransferase
MESLCIRVSRDSGEEARRKLIEKGALNRKLRIRSDDDYLLIPVIMPVDGYDIEKSDFEEVRKKSSPTEILGFAPAYEQIGEIAVIDRHEPEAQRIAEVLISQNKIRTVLQAETSIHGEYRTRSLSFLAGERKTETLYRENKCRYLLDLAKVYFTPRLSTERMRIANQIKDGEMVVDMFAGVGPFSILIAKRFPQARVIAIDKNPDAVRYLKQNVKLNKVNNVQIMEGDVRHLAGDISGADHIIMNLPQSGYDFLDTAFRMVKEGGLIHFYAIAHQDEIFEAVLKKIQDIAFSYGLRIKPVHKRMVRPYAPYQYNICIDFKVFGCRTV